MRVASSPESCQKSLTRNLRLRVLDRWTPTGSLHLINASILDRRDPEAIVLVKIHRIAIDFVGAQDGNPRFETRVRQFQ